VLQKKNGAGWVKRLPDSSFLEQAINGGLVCNKPKKKIVALFDLKDCPARDTQK
jgi:hypothetical protein